MLVRLAKEAETLLLHADALCKGVFRNVPHTSFGECCVLWRSEQRDIKIPLPVMIVSIDLAEF